MTNPTATTNAVPIARFYAPGAGPAVPDDAPVLPDAVTDSDIAASAVQCSAIPGGVPSPLSTPAATDIAVPEPAESALTFRDRAAERLGTYWRMPSLWTERWPSLAEVAKHANTGTWTTPGGGLRLLAKGWNRVVALPVATVCKTVTWTTDRFTRTFVIGGLTYLVCHMTPVQFVFSLIGSVFGFVFNLFGGN